MTPVRLTLIAAVLATASLANAAAAPTSPDVGAQTVQTSGTYPVDIAGQRPRARQGGKLRDGEQVISRRVALGAGRKVRIALTCPSGTVQRGLGISTDSTVAFEVTDVTHYIGARRVVILATARAGKGRTSSGHVYGLCS